MAARQIGPAMLLLGGVVGFLFTMQMQVVPHAITGLVGSQYWLTVFLASVLILDGSFDMERDVEGGSGLQLYPDPAAHDFSGQVLGQCDHAGRAADCAVSAVYGAVRNRLLGSALADVAVGAAGESGRGVTGNAAGRSRQRLAKGTRFPGGVDAAVGNSGRHRRSGSHAIAAAQQAGTAWWLWIQLLGGFALVFTTAGAVVYEYVIEE